ncbi:galactokinase-like protein [Leishmania major strain Friedlin]|uniref:Galactokinase-like protein n=1 Tax=Leishmania major TaxID=5664 RepID=E9AF98_LEIMA|nr:galactokinase-like protein [Leishmania major strain Friedlin]CAG9582627.1 galactokinase-like_protein [Leishmania major strain Friedlin]CBZ12902.1 galactokinase-like protein [Leishmania major strain Friedlin]|eukprot:XP_003722668.1 galactokinase-like protein [Leishmania major strain Friedlin]
MPAESYPDERLDSMLATLTPIFCEKFKVENAADVEWRVFTFAPGRVNLIGEHVDYMEGWTCPAAVLEGTHILVGRVKHFQKEAKPKVRFYATHTKEHFDMDHLGGCVHNKAWTTFVRGAMTLRLNRLGVAIDDASLNGVCMVVHSTLAMGAGMSASAAFGVALIHAINSVVTKSYKDCPTSSGRRYSIVPAMPKDELMELAKEARLIETEYCGVNVGIMDQFISAFAEVDKFMFLDCKHLTFEPVDMTPLLGHGEYSWMLIDSMIKHDLLGGTAQMYNSVRIDQENAQKKIGEHRYRGKPYSFSLMVRNPEQYGFDGDVQQFMAEFKPLMTPGEFERGTYQVMEQLRTLEFRKLNDPALPLSREERVKKAGDILNAGHAGMRELMKITTPELDYIQELINEDKDVAGGRMMGGGFGGCIIMLLRRSAEDRVLAHVRKHFKARFSIENSCYKVKRAGSGSFVVSLEGKKMSGAGSKL